MKTGYLMGAMTMLMLLLGSQLVNAEDPPAAAADAAAGKGTVIFFRPSKMLGAAIGFKVREGETELGRLRNGKYFVLQVEPGSHSYTVHSEAKDVLTIEVEAGETYYVKGTIGAGILAGRPNLSPSDAATFEGLKAKLKDATGEGIKDKDDKD